MGSGVGAACSRMVSFCLECDSLAENTVVKSILTARPCGGSRSSDKAHNFPNISM